MFKDSTILYDGNYLEVKTKRKNDFGPFQAIGVIRDMYDTEELDSDIVAVFCNISKAALKTFHKLKNTKDPQNNICFLPTDDLNKSKLTMHQSRIKELIDIGLIKRAKTVNKAKPIRKGSLMINPNLFFCSLDQKGAIEIWGYLK